MGAMQEEYIHAALQAICEKKRSPTCCAQCRFHKRAEMGQGCARATAKIRRCSFMPVALLHLGTNDHTFDANPIQMALVIRSPGLLSSVGKLV